MVKNAESLAVLHTHTHTHIMFTRKKKPKFIRFN